MNPMYDYLSFEVFDQMGCSIFNGRAADDFALQVALYNQLQSIVMTVKGPIYVYVKEHVKLQSTQNSPILDTFHKAFMQHSNGNVINLSEAEIEQFVNKNVRPVDIDEIGLSTDQIILGCQHPNKRLNQFHTFSFYYCPDCRQEVK